MHCSGVTVTEMIQETISEIATTENSVAQYSPALSSELKIG